MRRLDVLELGFIMGLELILMLSDKLRVMALLRLFLGVRILFGIR